VSYSMREPDWPPICECQYDEARDEMDRGNCPLHWNLADNSARLETSPAERKQPAPATGEEDQAA
jgi:hypothetical protein